MGAEIAAGASRGDGRLRRRAARRPGLDLRQLCFSGIGRGADADRGAAADARRDEPRHQRGAARARRRTRTTSSAIRSASSRRSAPPARWASARRSALVRERGLAMAAAAKERPGSMAAILGLADEVVEGALPQDRERVARELQLPGPARDLGRDRRGRRGLLRGAARRRAPRDPAARSRARSTRRSSRTRPSGCGPAIDKIDFKVPTAQFVSTVTAKLEDVGRYRSLLVEQLTAPVQVHAGRARAGRRTA